METFIVLVVLYMLMLRTIGGTLHCNETEYALIGQDIVINCQLRVVGDVYWYSEKTSFASPLVKLENGQKIVTEAGEGHYNISDDGALLVKGITEQQFDRYKIVNVNAGVSYEEDFVQLEQAIKPRLQCPTVNQCSTCNCTAEAKEFHNITCKIEGARPQVNLSLVTDNEDEFKITFSYDNTTDTFDTVVYKGYYLHVCSSSITVRCTVIGYNLFAIRDTYMVLHAEPCVKFTTKPTITTEEISSMFLDERLTIVIILVVAILVLMFCCICCIVWRRSRKSTVTKVDEMALNEPLMGKPQESYKDKLKLLVSHLEEIYKPMSYTKPIPWGKDVPIEKLYIDTPCKVTDTNGKPEYENVLSKVLHQAEDTTLMRALFIADIGHGKTTFRQYLACQWLKKTREEKEDELLFILSLKDLQYDSNIAEALCNKLPPGVRITATDLTRIIHNQKCILLLDGLDELGTQTMQSNEAKADDNDDFTIDNFLKIPTMISLPKVRIWVTSRNINEINDLFSLPYTKIHFQPFTDTQLNDYIKKTCNYYIDIVSEIGTKNDQNENITSGTDTFDEVHNILSNNDLISDFRTSPLLMVMFIHIITSKVTKYDNDNLSCINLEKMSTLVGVVMSCLEERYRQKVSNKSIQINFSAITAKLGKMSIVNKGNMVKYWSLQNIKEILGTDLEKAESIGLLRRITLETAYSETNLPQLSSPDLFKNVVFFHDYIQEYCVAQYLSGYDKESLKSYIANVTQNISEKNLRITRVFQFVCGINPLLGCELLKLLVDYTCWNSLVDCMYESHNEGVVNILKRLKSMGNIAMTVLRLDKQYHRKAFIFFCQSCKSSNISFKLMSFGTDCPWDFLYNLELPVAEVIEFRQMKFNDENLLVTLEEVCKDNTVKNIRFRDGTIPNKVDKVKLNEIVTQYTIKSIAHADYQLSTKNGKWFNTKPSDRDANPKW